jgi:hypothetical protein
MAMTSKPNVCLNVPRIYGDRIQLINVKINAAQGLNTSQPEFA